ncbi:P-loop containing nucleoside triphosphate hydrolase protein [Phlyctochytrium arcticum]|nr:P-loop containing nucleoside triphosphate hydrolase protein [Phlyctochytrium arcticum]
MAFWKPGNIAPGSSVDRESEKESGEVVIPQYNSNELLALSQQRTRLPIFKNRNHILYLVEKYQVVVIVGQTGSGKTTQLPQYLHEAGWTANGRVVACTQPRRVAATTVATRVAEEMGVNLGHDVGYTIRFDDCTDSHLTRIKYMTDGMLFRETLLDPLLTKYSVIMVDEAHERTLYTDILVGVLKKILKKRPELRIVISSATLDAEAFYNFYNTNTSGDRSRDTAVIMSLEGRMFPVELLYKEVPCNDYITASVETVLQIHAHEPAGDILLFLTGREEINTAIELITEEAVKNGRATNKLLVLPIYGGLTFEEQMRVFEPTPRGMRKVVVATNIAEASITIDGIVYVVDAGFVKLRTYNQQIDMESLIVAPISKASAQQRAGRAGRTRPGKVFRMYTEEAFNSLADNNVPEMQRSNLTTVVLQLKALGIENVLYFDFLSPPPVSHMTKALELLYSLKALDDYGRLTMPFGTNLAEFPVDPLISAVLMNSLKMGCSEEALTIAAMLSVDNVFVTPSGQRGEAEEEKRRFSVEEGDHITYLNVYNAFMNSHKSPKWCYNHFLNHKTMVRAVSIRQQLRRYLGRFEIPIRSCESDIDCLRKCLVSGYFSHAARLRPDGTYGTVLHNEILHIHPNSVLFRRSPSWVIYHEVVETTKKFMRDLTVVEPEWLTEMAPHFYELKAKQGR